MAPARCPAKLPYKNNSISTETVTGMLSENRRKIRFTSGIPTRMLLPSPAGRLRLWSETHRSNCAVYTSPQYRLRVKLLTGSQPPTMDSDKRGALVSRPANVGMTSNRYANKLHSVAATFAGCGVGLARTSDFACHPSPKQKRVASCWSARTRGWGRVKGRFPLPYL